MADTPGTISKILWHFTGGPRWNDADKRQERCPKPIEDAYAALVGILKSRELKIGGYKEVVNVTAPWIRTYDPVSNKWEKSYNVPKILMSAPVCCLADIPIMHLSYHAKRYGKIAIGFHREVVIRHGFGPVFYQLHNSAILQAIYAGFAGLQETDALDLEQSISDLGDGIESLECEHGHAVDVDRISLLYDVEGEANVVTNAINGAIGSLKNLLAFVKTFEAVDFDIIYAEREWRSVQPFRFEYEDISMIVLPRNVDNGDHYEQFVDEARSIPIPLTVSIVAWDDLVEH